MSRLNTSTIEEEIVLLYTLYVCGRRPAKAQATQFILSNHFLQERDRDYGEVTGGESRVENRIAWTRENLRRKGHLGGQDHGIWDITPAGIERLRKAAIRSLTWGHKGVRATWSRMETIHASVSRPSEGARGTLRQVGKTKRAR